MLEYAFYISIEFIFNEKKGKKKKNKEMEEIFFKHNYLHWKFIEFTQFFQFSFSQSIPVLFRERAARTTENIRT